VPGDDRCEGGRLEYRASAGGDGEGVGSSATAAASVAPLWPSSAETARESDGSLDWTDPPLLSDVLPLGAGAVPADKRGCVAGARGDALGVAVAAVAVEIGRSVAPAAGRRPGWLGLGFGTGLIRLALVQVDPSRRAFRRPSPFEAKTLVRRSGLPAAPGLSPDATSTR